MSLYSAVLRVLAPAVLMAIVGAAAAQQGYPSKPIRFVVPFPPGGGTDPLARMAAQKLAEAWGQQVIVDNRPGGNTIIGTDAVAKATPDGYTILLIAPAFITGPSLIPHLPYDTVKDFDAVATIAKSENLLVVNPSVPANTLREFIALAKSKPGQLNYGSSGVGTGPHLAGALFDIMAGTRMQHIPYKGSGPLISDLIGGQVQVSFPVPISVISHIKSGKLRAIAISGEKRLSTLPQVPSFTEAGLPGYHTTSWYGIGAPAGTPKEIIDKMSGAMAKILVMPDINEKLLNQGMEPFISTASQVTALIKADIARYAKLIRTANIKLEN